MIELTKEQCLKLEAAVMDALCSELPEDGNSHLAKMITQIAARTTITTIQEYERMIGSRSNSPQSDG